MTKDASSSVEASRPALTVRAWDLPTRLFKWLLVLGVAVGYFSYQKGQMNLHILNGYAVLVLIVFRVLWGVVGSSTARFSAWLTWPWTAFGYAVSLVRGRSPRFLGHNPLGGWMILALLALALLQGATGLFTVDNNGLSGGPFANLDFGDPTPLQSLMSRIHRIAFYALIALAVVHVFANVTYQLVKDDPLITGMVTGRKPALAYADQSAMRPAQAQYLRALVCLALAALVVFGGVKAFGGTLPSL